VLVLAIALVVLGTPAMLTAWLLWRAWWRQASARLSGRDGPGWLLGVGANLNGAVWWLLILLALWALPLGVLGAAAGSWRARRRRARQHADLAPTA
jgi:hypothetical protein